MSGFGQATLLAANATDAYKAAVMALGPVAYWKLDETGIPFLDQVAGNNLTVSNGGSSKPGIVQGSTHRWQGAYNLNEYGLQPQTDLAWITAGSPFSIMWWTKAFGYNTYVTQFHLKTGGTQVMTVWLIGRGGGINNEVLIKGYDGTPFGGTISFKFLTGNPVPVIDSADAHLWCISYNGGALGTPGNWAVHVDTISAVYNSGVGDPPPMRNQTDLIIMSDIDEVAIFNKVISGTDVTNLYNIGHL